MFPPDLFSNRVGGSRKCYEPPTPALMIVKTIKHPDVPWFRIFISPAGCRVHPPHAVALLLPRRSGGNTSRPHSSGASVHRNLASNNQPKQDRQAIVCLDCASICERSQRCSPISACSATSVLARTSTRERRLSPSASCSTPVESMPFTTSKEKTALGQKWTRWSWSGSGALPSSRPPLTVSGETITSTSSTLPDTSTSPSKLSVHCGFLMVPFWCSVPSLVFRVSPSLLIDR